MGRLGRKHVQSGSRYHTLVQCVGQVFLVHQGTAAGIYQNGRRFHKGQAVGIDQLFGIGCKGAVQAHHVTFAEQLIQLHFPDSSGKL